MHKIRPLWRIIVGLIMLLIYLPISSEFGAGQGTFYGWAFATALLITWVILSIFVPYDDPLRGIYEHIVTNENKPAESAASVQPSTDITARLDALEARLNAVEAAVKGNNSDAVEALNRIADILKEK